MREIPLTRGLVALVDDEDAEWLGQFRWCAINGKRGIFYAARAVNCRTVLMHRLIINAPPGRLVDHRDCNPLNNCRDNLRLATHSQNAANRGVRKGCSAGVKGVHRHGEYFIASICVDGQKMRLGRFASPEDAHAAYADAARKYFGEFARAA